MPKNELFLMKPVIISSMAYTRDRGNRSGGGNRNFGKPRFSNDRQEMHSAICANCGKQCEVPFRPTGNKPVLCRDCFQNNRGSDSRRPERGSYDRPQFNREDNQSRPNYQAQFDALNAKMDMILSLLTPSPAEVAPLESEISAQTIEEIAEEVQEEEKEKIDKKTKKAKSPAKPKK
jgi:CxxC-x17-CxxC domain-containing protein